jgi:serine/threonine-protein kinase RsbW
VTRREAFQRTTEIAASLEELRPLARWLQEAARAAGLPEAEVSSLDHALHEAIENVVRYAWADPAGRRINVSFRCDHAQAEVEVEDDGRPFDPRSVPPPDAPRDLASLVPGGYGVAIMRHLAHELSYERRGARNRLILRRRFRVSAPE